MVSCLRMVGAAASAGLTTLILALGGIPLVGPSDSATAVSELDLERATKSLSQFGRRTWTYDSAIPHPLVLALAEDQHGRLLIGTPGGLVRFDGAVMRPVPLDIEGVRIGRQVLALLRHDKKTWVGLTEGGVVVQSDGDHEPWRRPSGLEGDVVWDLAPARDGGVWVASSIGLERVDGDRVLERIPPEQLGERIVRSVWEDSTGTLWIGTGAGLWYRRDGTVRRADGWVQTYASKGVFDVVEHGGQILLCTGAGLLRMRIGDASAGELLHKGFVRSAIVDHENLIWVGTVNGLWRLSKTHRSSLDSSKGLPGEDVFSLYKTAEGQVWAGTDSGLALFVDGPVATFGKDEGLPSDPVWAVLEDDAGALWVGTEMGGLLRHRAGVSTRFGTDDGLVNDDVWSLASREGELWIGTGGGGVALWDGQRFTTYGVDEGLEGLDIWSIALGPLGAVYVGTDGNGMLRGQGGRFERWPSGGVFADARIFTIYPDTHGRLWVGTSEGAYVVTGDQARRFDLPSRYLWSVVEDDRGRLFFGTNDGDLVILDGEQRYELGRARGLDVGAIFAMVFADDGRLWLNTEKGIFAVPKSWSDEPARPPFAERWYQLGFVDGLRGILAAGGSAETAKSSNGTLWFATGRGLARVRPTELPSAAPAPPVVLDAVRIDGTSHQPDPRITMDPTALVIEVDFSVVSHVDGAHALVRWRIPSLEQDWTLTRERTLSFVDLPPGENVLEIQTASRAGKWSTGSVLTIDALPHFYETSTFRAGLLALAVLVGYLLYRQRLQSLRARNLELDQEVGRRRRVEEELRDSERRYRDLFENANDAVFVLDRHGEVLFANATAKSLLQDPDQDARPLFLRGLVTNRSQDVVDQLLDPSCAPPASGLYTLRVLSQEGRRVTLEVRRRVMRSAAGELQIHAIARDVTERDDMERGLHRAQKLQAVGQLTSGIAHDFNNLLTVIRGNLEILADARPSEIEEFQVAAVEAVDRAAALTDQLLAFSSQRVGQTEAIDVKSSLEKLLRMLSRVIPESIEVQLDAEEELPAINIDPVHFEQVILNLAVNARDAMISGGKIRISTRGLTDASGARQVQITVRDDGEGMDEDTLQQVFEPFFTTKPRGRGTGLGLSTVHGIMTRSGGMVEVDSRPGEGTTFILTFPASDGLRPITDEVEAPITSGSGHILVVEDEASIRALVERALARVGYQVRTCGTAEEALRVAHEMGNELDLVLTDVVLPGMNGRELRDRLRASGVGAPFLFMSGYTDDALLREGIGRSEVRLISKPFSRTQLLGEVQAALRSGEAIASG